MDSSPRPKDTWEVIFESLWNQLKQGTVEEQQSYLKQVLRSLVESQNKAIKDRDESLASISDFYGTSKDVPISEILKWQDRVNDDLLKDALTSGRFYDLLPCKANNLESCILSLDIRRSTDLMFQARSNEWFVSFLTELIETLRTTVKNNSGIIEKFTGDGLLCYFPKVFCGDDYVLHAVRAAKLCIAYFDEIYSRHRSSFECPILNTGISAGIARGEITVTPAFGGVSIVGKSVVMACRLNGGMRGEIWGTVQVADMLDKYSNSPGLSLDFETYDKSKIEPFLACRISIDETETTLIPPFPDWCESSKEVIRLTRARITEFLAAEEPDSKWTE